MQRLMQIPTRRCGLVAGLLFVALSASAMADPPVRIDIGLYEPAPTFQVRDLLPAEVVSGPNYTLEETVPVERFQYQFRIKTEWGTIPADGMNMLELRLREMYAIENARKMARDPQFVKGIFETIQSTPEGIKILLTEPRGALLRAPRGLERLVRGKIDPADRRAGSETRRRLAHEVGCDPETSNPILKPLLDQMALRKGLGSLATKAGLSFAVPGLGLLPTTKDIKELVATRAPHEINLMIEHDLTEIGIREELARKFSHEINFTTTQKLLFMDQLKSLRSIPNVESLVEGATEARDEAEGLAVLRELRLLNELNSRDPIVRLANQGLPVATTKGGFLVVISTADYLYSSQILDEALKAHRKEFPDTPTGLLLGGDVSPRGRDLLSRWDVQVLKR